MDRVRELEKIIDTDIEGLRIFEVQRSVALILTMQMFETCVHLFLNLQQSKYASQFQVAIRERIFDFQCAADLLVRWVQKRCPERGIIPDENFDSFAVANEAFEKAITHSKAEAFFMPLTQKPSLYDVDTQCDGGGQEYLHFRYASERVAYYEAVNERLLSEYNAYKQKQLQKANQVAEKAFRGVLEAIYSLRAVNAVELGFELPDTFRIGPYTIGQITEVWYKVIREAWFGDRGNRTKARGMTPQHAHFLDLRNLRWEEWADDKVDKKMTKRLLDDLTYTGKKKGKQKFTSLLTEPILEMENGEKFISPRFILQYLHGRNIVAALNRIYGDGASIDADQKEVVFYADIEAIAKPYSNLRVTASVELGDGLPDVDCSLYDDATKTLAALELKWLTEPGTSAEIKSKDEEIGKAITIQLPNYRKGIEGHTDEFTQKAFGISLEVRHQFYFVITRVSIGSGHVQTDEKQVFNIRMLKRALTESRGKLLDACRRLADGQYYPKEGVHFRYIHNLSKTVNGVKIIYEGHEVLHDFSLWTISDERVVIRGREMDPNKLKKHLFSPRG